MQSHNDFINKVIRLARKGEDFAVIFTSEREHLLSCEQCRQAGLSLLGEAFEEDELLLQLVEQAESGNSTFEPAAYPNFDFSFLESSEAVYLWRASSESREPHKNMEAADRENKLTSRTHVLRYAVEILLSQTGARLGELAAALQPYRLASIPVRGGQELRPEGLILEDPDNDVRIAMRLSGHDQLNILLSSISSTLVKPGRLSLVTRDEPKRTLQRLTLRPAEEVSVPLMRGDLVVQVEHEQEIWEIPIRVS